MAETPERERPGAARRSLSEAQPSVVISIISLAGTGLATLVAVVNGWILDQPYPANSFLFLRADRFGDYLNLVRLIGTGSPYDGDTMVYFPFATMVMTPFSWVDERVGVFILLLLAVVVVIGLALWATPRASVAVRLLLSLSLVVTFPVLFALDRANFEVLIFAFVAAFAVLLLRRKLWWAAAALSFAVAMKPMTGLYVVLLLRGRRWREALFCCLLVLAETLIALALLRPPIHVSLGRLAANLDFYNREYVVGDQGYAFSHGLFTAAKAVTTLFGGVGARAEVGHTLPFFFAMSAVLMLLIAALVVLRQPPLWHALSVLTVASLLLTPVSADYRLLLLLVPVALYLRIYDDIDLSRGTRRIITVLFALALVPRNVTLGWWHETPETTMALSVLSGATILTALMIVLVRPFLREDRRS